MKDAFFDSLRYPAKTKYPNSDTCKKCINEKQHYQMNPFTHEMVCMCESCACSGYMLKNIWLNEIGKI